MPYEFKLPDLGEGLTEGEVARWLVSEGDEVAEDQPLLEIQTDKTTVEIPSPAAGTVARILVGEGEVVPVGTVLVVIGGDGAIPPENEGRGAEAPPGEAASEPAVTRPASRIQATPLVRRVADELLQFGRYGYCACAFHLRGFNYRIKCLGHAQQCPGGGFHVAIGRLSILCRSRILL